MEREKKKPGIIRDYRGRKNDGKSARIRSKSTKEKKKGAHSQKRMDFGNATEARVIALTQLRI